MIPFESNWPSRPIQSKQNGSALNQHTLEQIKHAKEKRGVIVFTDPDYPGERLRRLIDAYIPGCKHAFLPKEKAKANGKRKGLGIEHAHIEDIQQALKDVYTVRQEMKVQLIGDRIYFTMA